MFFWKNPKKKLLKTIFFQNLKNIGIFKNKKTEIFWTRKFEFKKSVIIFLEKYLTFKKSQNFQKLFRKKSCAKILTSKNIYFLSVKNFEIFRRPQNRSIVVRFQFSALWDQISDRRTKNIAVTPPLGQCFDNYVRKVVSHVPMLVCVISVRSQW